MNGNGHKRKPQIPNPTNYIIRRICSDTMASTRSFNKKTKPTHHITNGINNVLHITKSLNYTNQTEPKHIPISHFNRQSELVSSRRCAPGTSLECRRLEDRGLRRLRTGGGLSITGVLCNYVDRLAARTLRLKTEAGAENFIVLWNRVLLKCRGKLKEG